MCFSSNSVYADELPHMKVLVVLIQLVILMTNIPMLLSTLKYSLTMLDSLLVVSCVVRYCRVRLSEFISHLQILRYLNKTSPRRAYSLGGSDLVLLKVKKSLHPNMHYACPTDL